MSKKSRKIIGVRPKTHMPELDIVALVQTEATF